MMSSTMTEPTSCCAACGRSPAVYCGNFDLLVDLDGLPVLEVHAMQEGQPRMRVGTPPGLMGCPTCEVVAGNHGRREVELIDAPCFGADHAGVVEADLVLP